MEAQDGSGYKSKKSFRTGQKMDIDDPDARPVKRTVLLANMSENVNKHKSPTPGKATRKRMGRPKKAEQEVGSQTNEPKSKNIFARSGSKGNRRAYELSKLEREHD